MRLELERGLDIPRCRRADDDKDGADTTWLKAADALSSITCNHRESDLIGLVTVHTVVEKSSS